MCLRLDCQRGDETPPVGPAVHTDCAEFLAAGNRPCASAAAQRVAVWCGQGEDHNKKRLSAITDSREIFTGIAQKLLLLSLQWGK